MQRTWELEDKSPPCITHGDANLTNIYLTADDRVRFTDWQFVALSS
jgi:aminoglycoside phosphotransferase (APT) family kinase protein